MFHWYITRLHEPNSIKLLQSGADRTFSIAAPHAWNKLSINIRQSNSISIFKKALEIHLYPIWFCHCFLVSWTAACFFMFVCLFVFFVLDVVALYKCYLYVCMYVCMYVNVTSYQDLKMLEVKELQTFSWTNCMRYWLKSAVLRITSGCCNKCVQSWVGMVGVGVGLCVCVGGGG